MGSKPRGVGRPSKNTLRIELRLNADDVATKRLIAEAAARGVAIQQHIQDILIARYLHEPMPQQQEPEQQADKGSASALADEWM